MKNFPALAEMHSHLSVRRAAPIAAMLALLLAMLLIGPAAGGGPREQISYVGKLDGYKRFKDIRFTIERQGDRNLSASFKARDVPLVCDNTFPDMDFPRVRFPFLGRRVFQGQHYERQPNGDFTYYEVKGRLLSGGRAAGYLYYLDRPFDPPGTEDRLACSTGGGLYIYWQARRR